MYNTPVLKAKLVFPDIPPGAFYCDRIRNLEISKPRAVILTAPAGYGKTTAVQLSLQPFRENTHWYRLDKEDAPLPVFFAHLIESLFGSGDLNPESRKNLENIGNIQEEYSLLSALACQDAWSFYAQSASQKYLVFDDFQNVADNPAIRDIIKYFISNMPQTIHIIVISRVETGIINEKQTLSGELVNLGETCLLFSKEEIETLFSGIGGTAVQKDYAAEAFDYTQGWIAGLALMKYTLGHQEALDREDFKSDKQSIFRYLLSEVFAGVDHEMIRQAAAISLLEEFFSDDLIGIFGIEDAYATIFWLERNNFYIQKISTDPPSYRFHSIFRDALQHVLAGEYSQQEIKGFHLAAAAHFEKTQRFSAAIGHFLSGGDEQSAVRIATERGLICTDNGDMESAASLIRPLPENLVFGNATLLMILGCSLCSSETERGFSYLDKAIDMAVKNKELDLAIKTQGFAISVCVQQNNFDRIKSVVDKVPMPKAMMVSKQARKMLLQSLFLKTSTSYQIRPAKILSRIVDKAGMEDQVELWQYSSLLSKASLFSVIGDFSESEALIHRLLEHPVALRNDRWRTFGLQLGGLLSNQMGKTDILMQCADDLTSLGLKYADGFASRSGAQFTALAKYQNRDLTAAIQAIDFAEKLFIESKNHSMAILADILQTAWQAEQTPGSGYAAQMEKQLTPLASMGGNAGNLVIAKALTAALYVREGSPGNAELLLEQAWKWAKGKQAMQSMCGIALHLSNLYRVKGDTNREEKYLKFFGETSSKKGYVYFREMSFAALVRTCARCTEKGIAPQHMAEIIGKYFGYEAVGYLLKNPSAAAADPDGFIARFPAVAEPGFGNVRIKLFGAFELTMDGRKIDPEIFKTRKIRGIFKYILANPGQTVSREKLAAIFWPDSDSRAAYNSLRVALFELRKVLTALDMAFDSDNALIAEEKNGFYVRRPEIVNSDVSRFTALQTMLKERNLSRDEEINMLREMTDLYDGDFLEDNTADEHAIIKAHYKAVYIEASYKLAEYYHTENKTELAENLMLKHLKIDPFDENLCGMLLELYRKSGRARQASAMKRQFTQYFEKEMGVKPEI